MHTGTCLSLLACHYGVCFFLTVLDLYGTPQVLMKYKIQKDKNITVSLYFHTIAYDKAAHIHASRVLSENILW